MKLVALLSWFDEQPEWLSAMVASLTKANVDHLVAVDGCYSLYPNALRRWRSPQQQVDAITAACYGAGIGLTLHIPTHAWTGNEVEKRNHLFDLGRTVTRDQDDWYLIIDGDEIVDTASPDLKDRLAAAEHDWVAYYKLVEPEGANHVRGLYRNHPDLHIRITHYGYSHGDQLLWDGSGYPVLNMTDYLILEHRQRGHHTPRHQNKWEYYRLRDELQIERVPSDVEVTA
jgi:hypothetical protein